MAQITEEIRPDEVTEVDPALRQRFIEEVAAAAPSPIYHSSSNTFRNWALVGVMVVLFGMAGLRFLGGTASNKLTNASYEVASSDGGVQGNTQSYSPSAPVAAVAPAPTSAMKAMTENEASARGGSATAGIVDDDASLSRKVHKSATLTLQVADPEARSEQIEDMVKSAGGFITNSNLTTDPSGVKTAQLTLKVPLPQFESSLAQIAKLGSVQAKNVTGEDITKQVSDADQRENILEQDMAEAQRQLKAKGAKAGWQLNESARDTRIQLAQSRARLRILKGLSELSEMDITLSQPPKSAPPVQTGFMTDIGANGRNAVQSALGALGTLLAFVMWILAYAPLWLPAFLFGRWGWKKYQKSLTNVA